MSLPFLVALVVGGISLIVLLIHLTGGTRDATLSDARAAMARFAADFPEETVEDTTLTADGRSAFLALSDGRTGIVQAFGDRFLTRIHAQGEDRVEKTGPAGLRVTTREFAWTGGECVFSNGAERDAVAARLGGGEH